MGLFDTYSQALDRIEPVDVSGRVQAVHGLTVSVADFSAPMGAGCRILGSSRPVDGRVIGFDHTGTLVMPIGPMTGICRGDRVQCTFVEQTVPVGDAMLGRVVDGFGRCIDGGEAFAVDDHRRVWPEPIRPMSRPRIDRPLVTGIRAIDGLLTVGRGQRMGVFSGSGVGKSLLLGRLARRASSDVTVVALIGERGREVRDFIERDLGPEGLKRCVVVVSTSDEPPLVRVQAGAVATAVAEHYRERGRDVLLLVDSLTRLATAQRQIGLVAGEPPTAKGHTPSVLDLLPQLLERCGRTERGCITGFYSVLAEEDEPAEPISHAVQAVADGHIHLSSALAQRGHWPAIDVVASVSRVMPDVATGVHQAAATRVRRAIALYRDVEELLNLGVYRRGANAAYDTAIDIQPAIDAFLTQPIDDVTDMEQTLQALRDLAERIETLDESADSPGPRSAWAADTEHEADSHERSTQAMR